MAYQGSKTNKIKILLCLLVVLTIIFIISNLQKQKETFLNLNTNNSKEPLQLECVLGAVNTNPKYLHFIPLFIKSWKKFYPETTIKIILIGPEIPLEYQKYKEHIILYSHPNKEISTAFISQFIRLLYPCLLDYPNGLMITDIDNIPLNRKFFKDNLRGLNTNQWVNLRDWTDKNQICMMWQVASTRLWKEVFQIKNIDEIHQKLEEVNSKINYTDGSTDKNWFTDQFYLYEKVMDWNKKNKRYVFLKDKDTGHRRLDRGSFKTIEPKLKADLQAGKFSDYHALRPPLQFEKINNQIVDLVR